MTGINSQVLNENGKYNVQKDDIKNTFWLRWAASKRRLVWQPVDIFSALESP